MPLLKNWKRQIKIIQGELTFAKGEGEHANDIVATYSDGTTYYVPLNLMWKYARGSGCHSHFHLPVICSSVIGSHYYYKTK